MKIAPTQHEGLREQTSTSAAPGRKFKVNNLDNIRIPLAALAVVKLIHAPTGLRPSAGSWPQSVTSSLVYRAPAVAVCGAEGARRGRSATRHFFIRDMVCVRLFYQKSIYLSI